MKTLNADYKTRDQIIFGEYNDQNYLGGTKRFEQLSLEKLESLVGNNFIDLDDCQNLSPTVQEFLTFMKNHPKVYAHGYVVSHNRNDYRVSIEGLSYEGKVSKELLFDFVKLCRQADEFVANEHELYAWWD